MLDDVPDKLRRNLLVYCCAILIGWYLDLDAKNLISVPGVDFKVLDKFKVSVLSLLVLLYLMLRFSHTPEYKKMERYFLRFQRVPNAILVAYVRDSIQSYEKGGRKSRAAHIFDWSAVDDMISKIAGNRKPDSIDIKMDASKIHLDERSASGSVGLICTQSSEYGVAVMSGDSIPKGVSFKIPKWFRRRQKCLLVWRSFSDNEDFVVTLLPVCLALVTYIYLLLKIISPSLLEA